MEREYQIALRSQDAIGNLPSATKPAAATVNPLKNEKASLQSIMLNEPAAQGNQPPKNPPSLLRQVDRMNSNSDIGGMDILPKSANSGFPKLTRNLPLNNDKKSYSSGNIDNVFKRKISPGLLPQEVSPATKGSNLSRQIDGVRLPTVVSVGNLPQNTVKSLPGMYRRANSAKNSPEVMNNKISSSVSKLSDGSRSIIRSPPSLFPNTPITIGKGAQQQVTPNSPQQCSSSPPRHSTPHGKPITSNQQLFYSRELSAVKSETSLSHFTDSNSFERRRVDLKSPSSVNESSK